jgi:hypothetical protein
VQAPAPGLIATDVGCTDVTSGTAAGSVLDTVSYPSSKGKIGQGISPGKFFFWTQITTTVPNRVVTISQSNTSTNNAVPFLIHQNWARIYTGDCGSWSTGTPTSAGASFTVPRRVSGGV